MALDHSNDSNSYIYHNQGIDDNEPQYRNRYTMQDIGNGQVDLIPVLGTIGNPNAKPLSGENVQKIEIALEAVTHTMGEVEDKLVELEESIPDDDLGSLIERQTRLLNLFYLNVNKTETNQGEDTNVLISCLGDSMTEGNGSTSGGDYPTKLQTLYNAVVKSPIAVDVDNNGVGGDTMKDAYDRMMTWTTTYLASIDMQIVYLGTNDFNKVRPRAETIEYLEKIVNLCLMNDITMLCVTPHKWRDVDNTTKASNGNLADYCGAIIDVCDKYCIPWLDLYQESKNLLPSAYKDDGTDDIHFNNTGYTWLANKIFSFTGMQHPKTRKVVNGNMFLGVRNGIDTVSFSNFNLINTSSTALGPREINIDNGMYTYLANNDTIYYTFYCSQDDMLLIPAFSFMAADPTKSLSISVFGGASVIGYSDYTMYGEYGTFEYPSASMTVTDTDYPLPANANITQGFFINPDGSLRFRYLPTKGWVTLKVTGTGTRFYGFNILDYGTYMAVKGVRPTFRKDGTPK